MDRPALSLLLALVIAPLAPACSDAPPSSGGPPVAAPSSSPPPDAAARAAPAFEPARLVAALPSGAVAAVAPGPGAGRAAAAPRGARVRDVVVDEAAARLVAIAEEDDGDGGVVAAVSFGRARIGPAERLAWLDGDARLVATPRGVVLVEAGYGERWRLLARDGAPRPSVVAPAPTSIDEPAAAAGTSLRALVRVDGGVARAIAAVDDAGPAAPAIAAIGADPPCGEDARWVEAPALGRAYVVDVVRGELVVRAALGERGGPSPRVALGPPVPVPVELGSRARLQHVVALDGGARLVALVAKPSRLVVLDGLALAPPRARALDLPGDVRLEPRFFSREVVAHGDRVFVATTVGVVALDVGPGTLSLDPGFQGAAISGPLAILRGGP